MKMLEFFSLIIIAWIDILMIKFSESNNIRIVFAALLMAAASVLVKRAEELVS